VSPELLLWVLARASGVASTVALVLSVVSGMALRSGALGWLSHNRAVRALHDLTGLLWLPLGAAHVVALVLDPAARIAPIDLLVPFGVPYGRLAIGLGTVSAQLLVLVMVTGWLRRHYAPEIWLFIHRLSYVAFAALVAHVFLSGTDFAAPAIAALAWVVVAGVAAVFALRLVRGLARNAAR